MSGPLLTQGAYTRHFAGDARAREYVMFFTDDELMPADSERAGRPIYREVEMVEIRFPGDPTKVVTQRVTDEHRQRWPEQYAAFKKSGSYADGIQGTRLAQWPSMTRSMVKELEYLGVLTVEMLAGLDDQAIARLGPGGRKWVERAKAFLQAAEDNAVTDSLAAQKADLEEKVQLQNAQIAELGNSCAMLTAQVKQLTAALAGGVAPQHLVSLPGSSDAVPANAAPVKSALESENDGYMAPKRRGRPSNAEIAARAASQPATTAA